jgi:hypothetical protein
MKYQKFLEILPKVAVKGQVVEVEDHEIDEILKCKPIVLLPRGANADVEPFQEGEILDLPFKTCFFEYLDDSPITSWEVEERGKTVEFKIDGLLVMEYQPRKYRYLLLMRVSTENRYAIHDVSFNSAVNSHFLGIVKGMLERFYTERVGTVVSRNSVKIRKSSVKLRHRIGQVIYISPQNRQDEAKVSLGKEVEWSHRWRVRGHWRHLPDRIGRDREGMPIKDYTWVQDHVKGPENQPIIEKVRVVK